MAAKEKILLIATEHKHALGAVRCVPGLQAAEGAKGIWLKCGSVPEANQKQLQQLPVQKTYVADEHNRLFYEHALTPVEVLENVEWQPVSTFITVEAPVAAMPATINKKVAAAIVASSNEKPAVALLTELKVWKQYAEQASLSRLKPLKFAVAENGMAFIWGTPLPPIPGKPFWLQHNLAVPCGYAFAWPAFMPAIAEKLSAKDHVILFSENGTCEDIPGSCFVPATRSAIRMTVLPNMLEK